jgi:hypothetical protein
LPTGTYYIHASSPARSVNEFKLKLRNTTDSTDTIIGTSDTDSITNSRIVIFGYTHATNAGLMQYVGPTLPGTHIFYTSTTQIQRCVSRNKSCFSRQTVHVFDDSFQRLGAELFFILTLNLTDDKVDEMSSGTSQRKNHEKFVAKT